MQSPRAGPAARLKPDFFVVGAAKAGTTALHAFLYDHPRLVLPARKETNFYALGGRKPTFRGPLDREAINAFSIWKREEYEAQFGTDTEGKVLGEVCPSYLYSEAAPKAIAADNPEAKIVMILRNPVDRAWSAYRHLVKDGRETRSFPEALALEESRIRDGWEWFWHLTAVSRYAPQVERYLRAFGRERIAIYRYRDLVQRTEQVLGHLLDFIGVEPAGPLTLERKNVSGDPRIWAARLGALLERPGSVARALRTVVPARIRTIASRIVGTAEEERQRLDPGLRRDLASAFLADVRRLEEITGMDLEGWKPS